MQWHQLDHMQIICTLLQTDNYTNTSSLNFYSPDALPDAQTTVSKHTATTTHLHLNSVDRANLPRGLAHTLLYNISQSHPYNCKSSTKKKRKGIRLNSGGRAIGLPVSVSVLYFGHVQTSKFPSATVVSRQQFNSRRPTRRNNTAARAV